MPRHAERWMGWRQARGPRRSCGSVAVPRAGRGGGCHGIRNRSMYLIRTGLASCRPGASARGRAAIPAGTGALRHGSGPVRCLTHPGPTEEPAGPQGPVPGGGKMPGGACPLLCGHRENARKGPPTGGREARRRIQKRPGRPRPSSGYVVRARSWRRCAGRPRRRSFPR